MKQLASALPANVARANFYQMLDEAGGEMRQFTIVPRNKPPLILMSVAEFDGWQETLEIMSDKKLMASLDRAKKEFKEGKGIPWEKAKKMLGWK